MLTWGQDVFKVAVSKANVRSGPGKDYRIVTTIKSGEELVILTFSGEWLKVKTPEGIEGWINRNLGYIIKAEPSVEIEKPPTTYKKTKPPITRNYNRAKKGIGAITNFSYSKIGALDYGYGYGDGAALEIFFVAFLDIGSGTNWSIQPTLGYWTTVVGGGLRVNNTVLGGTAFYKIPTSGSAITWHCGGGFGLHMYGYENVTQNAFGFHLALKLETKINPQLGIVGQAMYFIVFPQDATRHFSRPGLGLIYYFGS